MAETLSKLRIEPGEPARYALHLGDELVPLNEQVGRGLKIEFTGVVVCTACGARGARSYGGGYCYDCFTTLARADLCMMAPNRCHHHFGTCREPEWGSAFCMQPHVVYLANTAGLKVGLTRAERSVGRWLDQGATQGMVICHAATRREAGLIEVALAQHVSDRADWRKLVQGDAPPIDLPARAEGLKRTVEIPCGEWRIGKPMTLSYPIDGYGSVKQLQLSEASPGFVSRLLGCKGSYLLFEHGAFNVSAHQGFEVRLQVVDNPSPPERVQLNLF